MPPSVARSLTSLEREWIGPYGYEYETVGWKLAEPVSDADLESARALVVAAMAPCDPRLLMAELVQLRATTARRVMGEDDEAITMAAYRVNLAGYPIDVVRSVLTHLARTQKFFPVLAEIIEPCEAAMRERRMLAEGLGAPVGSLQDRIKAAAQQLLEEDDEIVP